MDAEEILITIHHILESELGHEIDLTPTLLEQNLRHDLSLDSLAMTTLQVAIEDAFDLRFDPLQTDLAGVFETVGSLANYVRANYQRPQS